MTDLRPIAKFVGLSLRDSKVAVAARLRRLAQKLDPQPTVVTTEPGGGWRIEMHGVPLAEISAGQISTERPCFEEWRP